MALLLPIRNNMTHPKKFPLVLRKSIASVLALYLAVGLLGYLAFAPGVEDLITLNLQRQTYSVMLVIGYALALTITYPMQMYPVWRIIESSQLYTTHCTTLYHFVVGRLLMLGVTMFVAVYIPHFGLFANFNGSFAATALVFVFPTLFYLKLFQNELTPLQRATSYGLIVFGIVGGCTSMYATILAAIKEFDW
jgi:amino acid permease